ncbi:MAG TPA: hypothetical protein VGG39_08235 [Polyangiaceae bacterium]|jgi:hypothetical protein
MTTIHGALRNIRRAQKSRCVRTLLLTELEGKAPALFDQSLVDELLAAGLPFVAEAICNLGEEVMAARAAVQREMG